MPDWRDVAKVLDSCHSLLVDEICEAGENTLRLVLVETMVSAEVESLRIGGVVIDGLHRIAASDESRRFELVWDKYIAYAVTNESFAGPEGTQCADSGRLLRCYSQSAFLDFVGRSTGATSDYPGLYAHLQVISENHIVDVVSTETPTVRVHRQ
jgi:hypothetical protein